MSHARPVLLAMTSALAIAGGSASAATAAVPPAGAPSTGTAQATNTHLLVASSPTGPWSPVLGRALFPGAGPIAPGDTLTDTFWVRNSSPDKAVLTISSVADAATARDPLSDDLHIAAAVADSTVPVDGAPDAATLATTAQRLDTRTLAPGETVPVTVAAGLPWATTTGSQDEDATWRRPIQVSLGLQPLAVAVPGTPSPSPGTSSGQAGDSGSAQGSDGTRSGGSGSTGQGPGGQGPGGVAPSGGEVPDGASYGLSPSPLQGALAHTGAEVLQLLAAGGGATLAGLLLLVAGRRRRRRDDATV